MIYSTIILQVIGNLLLALFNAFLPITKSFLFNFKSMILWSLFTIAASPLGFPNEWLIPDENLSAPAPEAIECSRKI